MLGFLLSRLRGTPARPASTPLPGPGREEAGARHRIVDVDGMIRQASTRVSVDQLIRNGKKYIQVLSREKIDELINRSVKTIVDKHRASADHQSAVSAAQIAADAKAEFEELLLRQRQTDDAARAVEQSKQMLEEASFELEPVKAPAAEPPPPSPDPSPPRGFEDVAREFDRQLLQAFKGRRLLLDRSESAEAVAELDRVQDVLRGVLAKAMDVERGRLGAPGGDPREIATLKKRIEKLLAHVATMEAALKTLSAAKTFSNQQVQNLLRDLGLAQEDRNYEKKKEMLKVVLNANQGIRRAARDLAARGVSLDAPMEKAVFTRVVVDVESGLFTRSSV